MAEPSLSPEDQALEALVLSSPPAYGSQTDDPDVQALLAAPAAPRTTGEKFDAGFTAGVSGLQSSANYFNALANTLLGDEKGTADRILQAQRYEEKAAAALQGLPTFADFVESPTLEAGWTQAIVGSGMVVPSMGLTVASALATGGVGAMAPLLGKAGVSVAQKVVMKRVIKDSVDRTLRGVASPDEKSLAELAFQGFKRGAVAGTTAASYGPLAGQNFGEGLDAGRAPDEDLAVRSLLVAAPQAALDVGIDLALLKGVGAVAKSRLARTGNEEATLFGSIAKFAGVGAVTEGLAEGGQEAISVANRMDMDDNYSIQDGYMRIAEGAFLGAIGGKAMGGVAGAGVGSISVARNVMEKATQFLEKGREQEVDAAVDKEVFGDMSQGGTMPEPEADVRAQLSAMLDDNSARDSVWIAGTTPRFDLPKNGSAKTFTSGGKTFYGRFVPGKGTILSLDPEVTDAVFETNGSDYGLQVALGYSGFRPADSSLVVEVRDKKGAVVWAEETNEAGLAAAMEAANRQKREGQEVNVTSVDKALEDRNRRLQEEQGPDIRPMEDTGDPEYVAFDIDNMPPRGGYDPALVEREAARAREALARSRQEAAARRNRGAEDSVPEKFAGARDETLIAQEAAKAREALNQRQKEPRTATRSGPQQSFLGLEVTEIGSFGRKRNPDAVFGNTQSARDAFEEAFADPNTPSDLTPQGVTAVPSQVIVNGKPMEVSWDNPVFAGMTEAMLRRAAREQKGRTDSVVEIIADENGYTLQRRNFDEQGFTLTDERGNKKTLPLVQFLAEAVRVAGRSRFARDSKLTIRSPEGKVTKVNPVDLTRAGQRLRETTDNAQFSDSGREGLMALLAELLNNGYDVQIDGQSINTPEGARLLRRSDLVADMGAGSTRTLGGMMGPTAEQRRPQVRRRLSETQDSRGTLRVYGLNRFGEVDYKDLVYETKGSQEELDAIEQAIEEEGLAAVGVEENTAPNIDPTNPPSVSAYTYSSSNGFPDVRKAFDSKMVSPEAVNGPSRKGFHIERTEPTPDFREQDELEGKDDPFNDAQSTDYDQPDTLAGPRGAKDYVGPAFSNMVRDIIRDMIKALGLKSPPKFYLFQEGRIVALRNGEVIYLEPAQLSKTAAMQQGLAQAVRNLNTNRDVLAQHITVGDEKIILFRESRNPLQNALVLGHELGHSLFKEEQTRLLANPALRKRLLAAYKKSPAFEELKERYGFDDGFEEWYADQVSLWANKRYKGRQARNMVEKHFKDFVDRLRKLWRSLSASLRKRFEGGVTQDFESYVEATIARRNSQRDLNGPPTTARSLSYQINEIVQEMGGERLAKTWREQLRQTLKPILKVIMPADNLLRIYGSQALADMFYVRSQTDAKGKPLGFITASGRKFAEIQNQFEDEIGSIEDPEVIQAFEDAASGTPTNQLLNPKAQDIRRFLERLYDSYVEPSNTTMGRLDNYFPIALDLDKIANNADEFKALLLANDPKLTAKKVDQAIAHIRAYNLAVLGEEEIKINELGEEEQAKISDKVDLTNPAARAEAARQLTANIDPSILADNGFLKKPQAAFVSYVRSLVKRVEWNRATKDEDGNSLLDVELKKLDPEDQALVRDVIKAYLGYQSEPLSPFWRKVNSWGQFLQFVTILPFAAIASLPELAGPVIASKDFSALATGMKTIAATIRNRQEAQQFARDIGVVTNEVVASSWMSEAEQDFMEEGVRKLSDGFFKIIGLDWFTRFTREFAAGMGVQFITKHARNEFNNPRSERYLAELGLTQKDVLAWIEQGRPLTTPEGIKVKRGLQRFVESSILRPNAAERPVWASDPHWALVWQLKGYFYSYGKVIMGGLFREARTRAQEPGSRSGQVASSLSILALTALATMPLAMLSMELREYAKYGAAALLPGLDADTKYFRSDSMDWPTYLAEIFDRSGFAGPLGLGMMMSQSANYGGSAITSLLGPTAETIETAFRNGFSAGGISKTFTDRLAPLYASL